MQVNDFIIAKKTLRSNWLVALIKHNTVKQLDDCEMFLSMRSVKEWTDPQNAYRAADAFIVHTGFSSTYSVDKADMWADRGWYVFEIR